MSTTVLKYFPGINTSQIRQFEMLQQLYEEWNSKVNVISRKDIEHLYERHVLHSLGIAKVISFRDGTKILDVGTGGGFPGIPLAILFPESRFTLVDSIGKKIKVVKAISESLGLRNVEAFHARAEESDEKFHFVVSRAVTRFPEFYKWVKKSFAAENFNDLPNGILYLKGGDIKEDLGPFFGKSRIFTLQDYFQEPFFESKKVVYFPAAL